MSSIARTILRRAWDETKARFPFETIAICLLPDHIHCIWKLPDGDSDYSTRWNKIKGLFSKRYIQQIGLVGEVDATRQKRRETIIW